MRRCPERASSSIPPRGFCASQRPQPRSGPPIKATPKPCPLERWPGEDALVTRPEADVSVTVLPAGGYAFAARLHEGATLAEAAEGLSNPDDFGTHLVGLVGAGAIASVTAGDLS